MLNLEERVGGSGIRIMPREAIVRRYSLSNLRLLLEVLEPCPFSLRHLVPLMSRGPGVHHQAGHKHRIWGSMMASLENFNSVGMKWISIRQSRNQERDLLLARRSRCDPEIGSRKRKDHTDDGKSCCSSLERNSCDLGLFERYSTLAEQLSNKYSTRFPLDAYGLLE